MHAFLVHIIFESAVSFVTRFFNAGCGVFSHEFLDSVHVFLVHGTIMLRPRTASTMSPLDNGIWLFSSIHSCTVEIVADLLQKTGSARCKSPLPILAVTMLAAKWKSSLEGRSKHTFNQQSENPNCSVIRVARRAPPSFLQFHKQWSFLKGEVHPCVYILHVKHRLFMQSKQLCTSLRHG